MIHEGSSVPHPPLPHNMGEGWVGDGRRALGDQGTGTKKKSASPQQYVEGLEGTPSPNL